MPSLLASALSPSAGAWLIDHLGVEATLAILTALAASNVVLVLWLVPWVKRRPI
jgi:hypothetical protein